MEKPQNITEETIIKAVLKAIEQHNASFYVPPEEHYQDHLQLKICRENIREMRANHEFISEVRKGSRYAKMTAIGAAVLACSSFFAAAIFNYVVEKIKAGGAM